MNRVLGSVKTNMYLVNSKTMYNAEYDFSLLCSKWKVKFEEASSIFKLYKTMDPKKNCKDLQYLKASEKWLITKVLQKWIEHKHISHNISENSCVLFEVNYKY